MQEEGRRDETLPKGVAVTPTILSCGEQALVFQLGESIDAGVNARLVALAAALAEDPLPGVVEVVPTYRSLLVRYDPETVRGRELGEQLRARFGGLGERPAAGRLWRVPVLYGGAVGLDLEALAEAKGLTVAEVVALHSGADYRIYMIGFAPGFAYLGGLPEVLHTPRLATPRQRVEAGAIGIGGRQASVNSVPGPSGWRYIGWTPVRLFDPTRTAPFLLRAGDLVRFVPIGAGEAEALAGRAATGDPLIRPEGEP